MITEIKRACNTSNVYIVMLGDQFMEEFLFIHYFCEVLLTVFSIQEHAHGDAARAPRLQHASTQTPF